MISVVMPTYNREKFISRSIQSVVQQSYVNWELLIIDDGSMDNTKDVVLSFNDPRIHYHYYSNQGASAARNIGIKLSKGEYVAFLDSDDEWSLNRLEQVAKSIFEDGEYIFFYISQLKRSPTSRGIIRPDFLSTQNFRQLLLSYNILGGTSNCVAPRSSLNAIQGFDEQLPSCQEHDLYIRLTRILTVKLLENEFVIINTDSTNRISKPSKNKVLGHQKLFDKYFKEMTWLSKTASRKKIALLSYYRKDWYNLILNVHCWILLKLLMVWFNKKDERELFLLS